MNGLAINDSVIKLIANKLYPINIVVEFEDDSDHSNFLGLKWELVHIGRVGVGVDKDDPDFNTIGNKLGEKTIKLTIDEMPKHTHYLERPFYNFSENNQGIFGDVFKGNKVQDRTQQTVSAGGNKPHDNIQPSEITSYWKRIA